MGAAFRVWLVTSSKNYILFVVDHFTKGLNSEGMPEIVNPRSLSRASMRYAGITMQIVRFPYRNSPVNSGCILRNTREIDRAVHTPGKVKLTGRKVLEISRLMEQTEKRH